MSRYFAKVKREHCPSGIARPASPTEWNGRILSIVKSTPRRVETTSRDGLPQVASGDELWICTDDTGPGIVGRAIAASVTSAPPGLSIALRDVALIPPLPLTVFHGVDSGSRIINQLDRNRHPDLYFFDDELFVEFMRVVEGRFGRGRIVTAIDWSAVIRRNLFRIQAEAEQDRQVPLALRPVRDGQRAFRDRLMRLYDGRCVVSGCAISNAVEAAHIVPWTGDPDLDREENGLILRRDLHGLFDAGLFAISPETGTIEIASALLGSEYEKLGGAVVCHRAAVELISVRYEIFREGASIDTQKEATGLT